MEKERTYSNCKHWIFSCPQSSNQFMAKTELRQPPIEYLSSSDIDEINKLCTACPEFEEND